MASTLSRYLARLGYGSRRDVEKLIRSSRVTNRNGGVVHDGESYEHDDLLVNGEPLDPPPGSVVMLNKPVGYVCSTNDRPPLVYELLPRRFPMRSPIMSTIGRLDADTSGLLLLTDDGALNHRLASPRHHMVKTYHAVLSEPLADAEEAIARFASGSMMLNGEHSPLLPAALTMVDHVSAIVEVSEGRYHQVRRMFAALGNNVESLCRTAIGPLTLGELGTGEWRVLNAEELDLLRSVATRGAASKPA